MEKGVAKQHLVLSRLRNGNYNLIAVMSARWRALRARLRTLPAQRRH
jgi:hypothetical protein